MGPEEQPHHQSEQQRAVEAAADAAGGIDRRRSAREPVVTVGVLRSLAHDDALGEQVLVTNVSLHGVGFRTAHKMPAGSRWAIEIGVGPLHLTSRLRVVRSRPSPDGTYDVGGEFF